MAQPSAKAGDSKKKKQELVRMPIQHPSMLEHANTLQTSKPHTGPLHVPGATQLVPIHQHSGACRCWRASPDNRPRT